MVIFFGGGRMFVSLNFGVMQDDMLEFIDVIGYICFILFYVFEHIWSFCFFPEVRTCCMDTRPNKTWMR